jgi:hypothetical protein
MEVKGKHIRFRDSDSSHSSHSHSSDWQEHSVPSGFDPQGNVSAGSCPGHVHKFGTLQLYGFGGKESFPYLRNSNHYASRPRTEAIPVVERSRVCAYQGI